MGILCWFLFGNLSSFAVFPDEEEKAGRFACIVFLMSFCCYCSVGLPNGVMGWSAVCEYGIS